MLVAAMLAGRPAHADPKPAESPPSATATPTPTPTNDRLLLTGSFHEESGRTFRLQGIVLTITGALVLGGAIWGLVSSSCDTDTTCEGLRWMGLASSLPMLGYGITMWAYGQGELNRTQKVRAGVGLSRAMPFVAPLPGGGAMAGARLLAF
jgi:hypothetical protein